MKAVHEPDPGFLEHLEWQVRTAVRRRERFAEPVGLRARTLARTCALVLLSVTVGAAGAVAAGRLQDSELRELLLARQDIQVDLAGRRVAAADRRLDQARQRVEQGVASEAEVRDARGRSLEEHLAVSLLTLEREEIALSGTRPLDALSAPLVHERDFVSDRLELERDVARQHLDILREERGRTASLVDNGLVGAHELDVIDARIAEGLDRLEELDTLLALRREFLMGERSAEETELLRLEAEVVVQLKPLRREREAIRIRLDALRRRLLELEKEQRARQGDEPAPDLERELALRAKELEDGQRGALLRLDDIDARIEMLTLELRILRAELGRPQDDLEALPPLDPSPGDPETGQGKVRRK